ncbi:hypothetical protein BDV32DRAFT_56302 [Aspergillus pseudonomiae]|nr:hypothetical protein BDV32DRAFT_56302 [Aspergillus pseudonomiae]
MWTLKLYDLMYTFISLPFIPICMCWNPFHERFNKFTYCLSYLPILAHCDLRIEYILSLSTSFTNRQSSPELIASPSTEKSSSAAVSRPPTAIAAFLSTTSSQCSGTLVKSWLVVSFLARVPPSA